MTPIFALENIHRQYLNCRRNKRNTINALRFEYNLEENLIKLREELENQTYGPSRSVCFVLKQPKLREIFAADFRDRVVHHILVDYLEKIWEPVFIYDSYACRRGKGTHAAVHRLQSFMRKVSRNGTRRAYFIHMDIHGFFLHIDKEVLFRIVAKRVKDEKVLWLARQVIFHDCTKNFVLKGKRDLLEKIPPHKTLFGTENKRGLPIGNLASQFFSNVYLNELDQFVKHQLRARYYVRYSDDFVLLHEEKETLLDWKAEVKEFLQFQLRLLLNERRQSFESLKNGVDFLGYIVRPDYLLVRRRVVNCLKAKLASYEQALIRREGQCVVLRCDHGVLERLMATWSSYMAHLKIANTYRLRQKLLGRTVWMDRFFQRNNSRLQRRYALRARVRNLKTQYHFFLRKCRGSIIFFQVGRFYEFYDRQAERARRLLGLRQIKSLRGFQTQCGFPANLKEAYLTRILRLGFSVHVVEEKECWLSAVKQRRLSEVRMPAPLKAVPNSADDLIRALLGKD